MCGICGKLYYDAGANAGRVELDRMMHAIRHRGPDGEGRYLAGPVGLGHRRLSIIDVAGGAQPIANEDGTVWIVYNGELYNYRVLRDDLRARGHVFRTASDTEVIVHLYEEYGVDCLQRMQGMFAFALWDEKRRQLFCARDRVGIKPFYYADTPAAFVFGSEIKAVLADPHVPREVDVATIDTFLTFSFVPGEGTLFQSVRKLPPAHYLLVRENGVARPVRYWDLHFGASVATSFDDAARRLRERLEEAVAAHMVSDVPVGVLLSGGVDSTTILACASKYATAPLETFTVGFSGAEFEDERPYASLAASRYGSRHHSITVPADGFARFLDDYVWHMEEPVYEPPAVALHFVSRLAREHVKVVLSGEGGDEAFGGYQTYRNLLLLEKFKGAAGERNAARLGRLLGMAARHSSSPRLHKYAPLLGVPLESYYYSRRSSPFAFFPLHRNQLYGPRLAAIADRSGPPELIARLFRSVDDRPILDRMLYVDTMTWLPDDLLVKADKITMANSLELRVPMLDHSVLEFAATLPGSWKVRGFETKRILKRAFADAIPASIAARRKAGFPVPVRRWLRDELRDFVHDRLLSERALHRGYFEPAAVRDVLQRLQRGEHVEREVFSLLVLELWHRHFVDAQATAAVPSMSGTEPVGLPAWSTHAGD
jgi:asparagine synthase (glutamine-hydrolysing)